MDENILVKELSSTLPKKFIEGKEVIDFKTSTIVPFVLGIIIFQDELLLMKRSNKVGSFVGNWHVVAGHFDEIISAENKLMEEVAEEAGYEGSDFEEIIKFENIFTKQTTAPDWLIIPFRLKLKSKQAPKLNWEHDEFKWLKLNDLYNEQGLIPGIKEVIIKLITE